MYLAKIFWLLPPIMLFTMSIGLTMVPRLNLILSLICQRYLADKAVREPFISVTVSEDNSHCRQNAEVQALVAQFTLTINLITGILSAIASPRLGALSDRYGRKNLIAITTIGI